MIPIRLEIKNFLPYRTPDHLLFEGIHLACLTGSNGAGKSALLDAITYALWGRARGSARSDAPLIHQGQKEMAVLLEFEQEGERYRVQRGRNERNQGNLLFMQLTSDGWQNRNGQNMGDTDRIIRETLRLDYETFVNSAFLQQGRADAFTTKTPAERKKILGEILGLEQWAVYEERAKAAINESQRTIGNLEHETRGLNEELSREPQYKREFEAAELAMQQAQTERDVAQAKLDEVSYVEQALRDKKAEMERKTREQRDYLTEQAELTVKIQQITTELTRSDVMLAQAEAIESGYQTLQNARNLDSSLGEKLSQSSALQSGISRMEQAVQKAQADLEQDRRAAAGRITELERQRESGLAEQLAEMTVQIIALEQVEKERDEVNRRSQAKRETVVGLYNVLHAAEAEGKKRAQHLEKVRGIDNSPICPLCGQALSAEHLTNVQAELEQELNDRRQNYQSLRDQIRDSEEQLKELDEQKEVLAQQLAALPRLRKDQGGLQQKHNAAEDAVRRLLSVQAEHDGLQARIEAEDYAHVERAELLSLYAQRDSLGYDGEAHNTARATLQEYRDYETQQRDLEVARQVRPGLQTQLDTFQQRQARIQGALAVMMTELDEIKLRLAELEALQIDYRLREREVMRLALVLTEANQRLGGARQKFENLDNVRRRLKEIDVELDEVRDTRSLYQQLQTAFSKKGIPAMMIETALPELELEANRLLTRMSDGRMHVALKTQRATQAGDTTETLDIDISDELGTRSYDLYSGGESFRINFALRVALSKMLARRAGAQLRTLFIDEGFGTQDEDGRGRLIEAINVVQDDFDLVLVITHIDELRDSFPVHIVIEKTTSGSSISVR